MYRDDLEAAHARVEALEKENRGLKEKLAAKPSPVTKEKKKVKCGNCGGRFHRVGTAAFLSFAGIVVAAALVGLMWLAAVDHGDGDHCYLQRNGGATSLEKVVIWAPDRTIGWYKTVDDALADAKKIGCPVK